ncbi:MULTISPECIES: hypothetical protein [unclassified Bradyrhizobium]|uniref:hypothetical protein n=1 Tax=unclassified Bradyrhizobium TaxID=2631580 RepID=UPI0023B13628|nr:hypothetical protein [Bradyrhizobium sp. CSS354]MDE5461555.1 hypothetical protein [Bradyrhizobium sp. CSS354]
MSSADESGRNNPLRKPRDATVNLSAPWGLCTARIIGDAADAADEEVFIVQRSALHALYISETEQTKRLSLSLAAGLLALACILPIFAPPGREVISYWLSISLFVFSAGSIGFTNILYRTKESELNLSGQ